MIFQLVSKPNHVSTNQTLCISVQVPNVFLSLYPETFFPSQVMNEYLSFQPKQPQRINAYLSSYLQHLFYQEYGMHISVFYREKTVPKFVKGILYEGTKTSIGDK